MVDGNIADSNMHGHVQDKQKETRIGFKKTRIGSILISFFTALMLLPRVPSSGFQLNGYGGHIMVGCIPNHRDFNRRLTGLGIVFTLALIIFAILMPVASAADTPTKLIMFTDKRVYADWQISQDKKASNAPFTESGGTLDNDLVVYVYAMVLDDDGNVIMGRSGSLSGTLDGEKRLDHYHKADSTIHHAETATTVFDGYTLTFVDDGSVIGDTSGDGVYTARVDLVDPTQTEAEEYIDDHFLLNITVTDSTVGTEYTYALVNGVRCHGSASHGTHAVGSSNDICAACHFGYEHFYEDVSGTIPDSMLDVHFGRMNPPTVIDDDVGFGDWDWNASYTAATRTPDVEWGSVIPGSRYCYACHVKSGNILDYGAAGRTDNTDVPTCNDAACHDVTEMEGTSSAVWGPAGMTTTDYQNYDIYKAKSHNHTDSTQGIPCATCHNGPHGLTMPNIAVDISSEGDINNQCTFCHDRSDGWINISNNVIHTSPGDCTNCHISNNKLDSHLVPVGVFGGKWCLDCHNLTGTSPINMKVDPDLVNISNSEYIHNHLNEDSDTINSSRICWGCHTNDSYVINGRVNSTGIPDSVHPTGYETPRNCTDCHHNTSTYNFGAPQNVRHTWYSLDMNTPFVTSCADCHAQDEMLNTWTEEVYPPSSENQAVSHYGKNRTSFFTNLTSGQYCNYCHQNESTVMGPFANLDNEVRSDHASQVTTPGCADTLCHNEGRLHEDSIVIPEYNESNFADTCLACHSPINYSNHNNTITCWDCHMGNVSEDNPTWIHPIQFIQSNGNFTGAKLTSATCYDCHKSTNVDSAILNLSGIVPSKINSQAHSNNPNNGTIWGEYWDYTPTSYEFATYYVDSGGINQDYPFSNIMVPSNDFMELIEVENGSANEPVTFPYTIAEQKINGPPVPNWTSSTVITNREPTITAVQDATTGNAPGSLKASLKATAGSSTGTASWNYSFYYNPDTFDYAITDITADYKITVESALMQNVYLRIVKPSGAIATLASASSSTTTGWLNLANTSFGSALNENGSVVPYKIQLHTEFSGTGTKNTPLTDTVNYDNILLNIQEKVHNRYNITISTTDVPVSGSSKIGMSYQAHMENTSLLIYNKTSEGYDILDYLDKGVFFDYIKNISSTHHIDSSDGITGNVSLRFVDTDQSDTDAKSDKFHIRYLYVYTDSGLQYPCEQCHSPNKHYINPTLGSPSKFSAGNSVSQPITSSSTWCQQCHWDGADNYSEMIQEYTVDRHPPENVPPEITGNTTYAPTGVPGYYPHDDLDMDDASCFACHGAAGDTTTTEFMHNVQVGSAGGINCTQCHDTGMSNTKVDVSGMNTSVNLHLNLNKDGITSDRTEDRICWGCHVTNSSITSDGRVDYSELGDGHPKNFSKPAVCTDCHLDGGDFSAPLVNEHVPLNYATGNISTNSSDYCGVCHNNSLASFTDPNNNNPMNASASHYATNATLPTGCTWCHYDNPNNASWQSPIDPTIGESSSAHTGKNDSDCATCHGGSGTLHDESWGRGAGSCDTCHAQPPNGTLPFNRTGAHDLHKAAGYGDVPETSCDYCHSDGGLNESHPQNDGPADILTNASANISIYSQNTTSGNDDTCSGVSCHANSTISAAANIGTATWNTATAGACNNCHSSEPTGIPPTGNHTTHYTNKGYTCAECHGTDADAGTQFGHRNNALIDISFTNVSGSINASKGCAVYCHSPNINDPQPDPTWNVSTVACDGCHSIPPTAFTTQKNQSHPASSGSDCNNCHGIDAVTGDHADHLNGSVDTGSLTCYSCHAQPPSGALRPNMTGAHDTHNNSLFQTRYGALSNDTGCDYCHNNGGTNEGSHPQYDGPADILANASANIVSYTQNTTSGSDDTCSGVSCHANSTISAAANIGTATWDTVTAGACNNCHSSETTGIPPTGNHVTHYTNKGYTCAECHGTDADAGTQSGHRNNALIDISFTNVSGSINASKGCAVYCHSPNTNDPQPDPTWNVSTVACDGCHSIPPTAFTTQKNQSHPASTGSDCNNCHGIDAVTGDHAGHLNGSVDIGSVTCYSCHAQPPSGALRPNMTGAHDTHNSSLFQISYGALGNDIGCDYCHFTEGVNETNHPNSYDNATVMTNASANISTYSQNTTSGNDDTCSGVSCHANGTISTSANIGTATWNTATAGACNNCHSSEATGIPPTGNHVTHYINKGYTCAECHGTDADAGAQTGHKNNSVIDIIFTNVTGSINASKGCDVYCHSPNLNDVRPNPIWNVSTVVCGDCHTIPPATVRNGTAHTTHTDCDACHGTGSASGTQTGHMDGIIDISAAICDTCHGQLPSGTVQPNMVGAHATHNSSTFQILYGALDDDVSCNYCHNTGGINDSAHPQNDSIADVVTNATVNITTYIQNTTSGNDDTCSGVSCHTNGLNKSVVVDFTTWNNNTGACDVCHSTETSGLPDTDNHSLHYTTKGYPCDTCHGTNAGNGSQSGHMSNSVIDINFTGLSEGTFNAGACDEYCHSPNLNDPKPDPIWGVSTVECGDCHSIILNTTRNGDAHSNDSNCDNCHGLNAINGTQVGHVNGIIDDVLKCLDCHDTVTSADLGIHSSFTGTSDAEDGDCATCHFKLPHPAPNSNNTHYCEDCHTSAGTASPKSTILFTEKMHGEAICADCHVADTTYHQGDPRGAIANTTYVNRYVPGNTTVTDCADCHYARNLDDAPFNAPGGGSHTASACATGGCHAGGPTMIETVHSVGPYNYGYKPAITVPSLNVSTIIQGTATSITVTATVSVSGTTRQYVDGAQYRIMSGVVEVVPWTSMNASDGDFWGYSDAVTASINTTTLSSGTYAVEVRSMAGGPSQNAAIRYYPMNGDVSATQSALLTVEPPTSSINGTVTYSGAPLAGAIVSTTGASTTTAADGTYSLSVVAGTHDVMASKAPTYADSTATGVVVILDTTTTQDFVLSLKPTGTITGTVTVGTA